MNGLWNKKLPAFFLTLVMIVSMMPMAYAAKADISYDVDADDDVTIDEDDFVKYFEDECDDERLEYVKFSYIPDFDHLGHFYAYDEDNDKVYMDEDDLDDYYFYYRTKDMTDSSDLQLDGLTFEAYDDADTETITIRFICIGDDGYETDYGYMEINVDGGSSSAKGGTITYKLKAGGEAVFDEDDFEDILTDKYSSSSPRYVVFDTPTSSAYSNITLYYKYGKSSSEDFSRSELEDYKFYFDDEDGDYPLSSMSIVAGKSFKSNTSLTFTVYGSGNRSVSGTLKLTASGSSSSKNEITQSVKADDTLEFDSDWFNDLFDDEYDEDFDCLEFTDSDSLDDYGSLYCLKRSTDKNVYFDEDDIEDTYFYRSTSSKTKYLVDDIVFESDRNTSGETVTLDFTLYGDDEDDTLDGTLTIEIGKSTTNTTAKKGDITYTADDGEEVEFDEDDFNDYFQETYSNYDLKYVYFTDSENLSSSNGTMYVNYGSKSKQESFSASSLEDAYFYYDEDDMDEDDDDCYLLEDLSFVAGKSFTKPVTLDFVAYYGSSRKVSGTVVINPEDLGTGTSYYLGNVRYTTTTGKAVQINANDIARFFTKSCPGYTLQYVMLTGVPSTGSLYYNYYNASKYGSSTRGQITSYNASGQVFYLNPSSTSQYALSELTYVPSGSNYCTAIPFTAYGTGGRSVSGAILISVSTTAVAEVYGPTPKNTSVNFPATSIYNAVLSATGIAPSKIQLLSLPSYTAGTVYVGSSGTTRADTSTAYSIFSGSQVLRFVPSTNYTGSVEIPYVALNSSGTAIASGTFSLGMVNSVKKFSDVTSSTWCYKYVTELSDASVISGYNNGSFKPNSTVTYGAALKLIMLAAGYPEQAPTTKGSVFSGYLTKARAEGIITSSNVNLSKPITRLQVAQLAAGAMKLSTSGVSSTSPFTDTSDASVLALNAAGIVEGYFSNGTSTFKPNNTLTRGQVSAIVWRMRNYNK